MGKKIMLKNGEIVQQLRELLALTKDLGLVPSAHMATNYHLYVTPVPGDLALSSVLNRYSNLFRQNAHSCKIKFNRKK